VARVQMPPQVYAALVAVHVLANMVWIGSLLAEAVLVERARLMADRAEIGGLARRIHLRLAVPAFLASLLFGVARFVPGAHEYLHAPWMHVKLTCALGVIVVHHILGAKAKRTAAGEETTGAGWLALIVFVLAAGAVFMVTLRP
jgi:putative membrane protein